MQTSQQGNQSDQILGLVQSFEAGNPILLSQQGSISPDVLEELERLNTEHVTLYTSQGDNQSANMERLAEAGVEEVELRQGDPEEMASSLQERKVEQLAEEVQPQDTLVLSAGQELGEVATIPYLEDLHVFTVQSEAQIPATVDLVNNTSTDNILATGSPELVDDIARSV